MINTSDLGLDTKKNILEIAGRYDSVVILDVSYHLYRCYYAYSNLSVVLDGGEYPTGHMYGFLRLMEYIKKNLPKSAIILVIDGYDEERKLEDPNYKEGRSKVFNVHKDTKSIIALCSCFEGVFLSHDNTKEADDTMYNIAETMDYLFTKNNISKKIYVFTSDKDLYSSVGGNVFVLKSFGKKNNGLLDADIIDEEKVREKFHGVSPKRLKYFRAITGDASDKLKGIERFPKKVASKIAMSACFEENDYYLNMDIWGDVITKTEQKWLNKLTEHYQDVFNKNLRIMTLKEYIYTLNKLEKNKENAKKIIEKYNLISYKYLIE